MTTPQLLNPLVCNMGESTYVQFGMIQGRGLIATLACDINITSASLASAYVEPEFRSQGIMSALLDQCLDTVAAFRDSPVRPLPIFYVHLYVSSRNPLHRQAAAFWERRGFVAAARGQFANLPPDSTPYTLVLDSIRPPRRILAESPIAAPGP